MIITSIPRSGSTHYCIELAKTEKLHFVDEPFSELNQKVLTFKKRHHECSKVLRKQLTFDDVWQNRNSYVISNHNTILPLMIESSVFLARKDLRGAMLSLWAKLKVVFGEDEAAAYLKLYFSWTNNFIDYVLTNSKSVLLSEDLGYTFTNIESDTRFDLLYKNSNLPITFPI
jgi:hypothetical protein